MYNTYITYLFVKCYTLLPDSYMNIFFVFI